ncbi:MAG: hypothetical protein HN999_09980 [Candidatus Marinimicrobia bacterium]|nr:hypothetical protein [Candidatus Neomarinimicrobiota bacterium]MBT4635666.1 hypothetical protein [Candidatus Neomarinimicrobiota bacterium]MBT6943521.1 hypothetical protein [Candidatus Neomarinimicrobiota bacterium]
MIFKRLLFISSILVGTSSAQEVKWMAIGDLHNWYSAVGCEIELGRTGQISDQQDGLRYPAFYRVQDNQAAKGLWLGAKNFYDPLVSKDYEHKVVHAGPRHLDIVGETIPKELTLYGKYDHSNVFVDGDPATNLQYLDEVDEVDPDLLSDRKIVNVVQTSMGVEIQRTIYAFAHPDHQNYHIQEYVFTNNGCYDADCNTSYEQTLDGFQVYLQYRYAISREGMVYDGKWLPQSAAWGHNTMNDAIGENPDTPSENDQFYDDGSIIRGMYSWHGYHSSASFDNIGGPNSPGEGHLGAAQFVGVTTLHADTSPSDATDDIQQPSTTWFITSDDPATSGNDQYNETKSTKEYNQYMSAGHPEQSQAEVVGTGYADQFADPRAGSNPGGTSQGIGFGPYNLAPGESVRIVLAEGAAGLSREMCYQVGQNWKNDVHTGDMPTSSPLNTWMMDHYNGGSGRNEYKNAWVFTGADSIIETFKKAKSTFDLMEAGQTLPFPPKPPAIFNVTSGGDRITIDWSNESEAEAGFDGYNLYRLKFKPDTSLFYYDLANGNIVDLDESIASVWELPPGTGSYEDLTPERGFDYYYFLEAFDNGTNDDMVLNSSKFFTLTNKAAFLKRPPGTSFNDIRIVPNPFHISARDLQYGVSAPDRLMFLNIPPVCTIRIFTERGDLVDTIEHSDGSGDEAWNSITSSRQLIVSGLYIAHFDMGDQGSAIRKFTVIR